MDLLVPLDRPVHLSWVTHPPRLMPQDGTLGVSLLYPADIVHVGPVVTAKDGMFEVDPNDSLDPATNLQEMIASQLAAFATAIGMFRGHAVHTLDLAASPSADMKGPDTDRQVVSLHVHQGGWTSLLTGIGSVPASELTSFTPEGVSWTIDG